MASIDKRNALALACALALGGVNQAAAADTDMQKAWRDYARQRMAPAYSWSGVAPAKAPDTLSAFRASTTAASSPQARLGRLAGELAASTTVHSSSLVQSKGAGSASALGVLGDARNPISGEFVASSIESNVAGGQFRLSAILARQRYASARLGLMPWNAPVQLDPLPAGIPQETSSGGGVRMAYSEPLGGRLSFNFALQSKLDMEPFKSYRGVYSDPGDFDVPARAELGLGFALTDALHLSVGAERVFYSDTDTFTSAALPSRFLALLGDGTSPNFAWRDLTVYTAELALRDGLGGEWSLRWTSRQQPSPTSQLLLLALEPEFTDTNLGLGYRHGLGAMGELWLAASYAPSRYFLGAVPYVQRELDGGSQVEIEALWSIPF